MVKVTSLFLKANINTYLHENFLAHELSALSYETVCTHAYLYIILMFVKKDNWFTSFAYVCFRVLPIGTRC